MMSVPGPPPAPPAALCLGRRKVRGQAGPRPKTALVGSRLAVQDAPDGPTVTAAILAKLAPAAARTGDDWPEIVDKIPGATIATLDAWSAAASHQHDQTVHEAAKARRQDWKKWVLEAARNRPGLLFRWVRGDPPLPVQGVLTPDGRSLCPVALVETAATAWRKLWNPPGGQAWAPRAAAPTELPPLDGADLARIARAIPAGKAGGADGWRVRELQALPEPYWTLLAELLSECERQASWPDGLRQAAVSLLPKEGESELSAMRPVTILPLVYRVWAAARRGPVKAWEVGAGADGAEIVGLGAEDAAWDMACTAEVARLQGQACCGVFLDPVMTGCP